MHLPPSIRVLGGLAVGQQRAAVRRRRGDPHRQRLHVSHAGQTVALLREALAGRRLAGLLNTTPIPTIGGNALSSALRLHHRRARRHRPAVCQLGRGGPAAQRGRPAGRALRRRPPRRPQRHACRWAASVARPWRRRGTTWTPWSSTPPTPAADLRRRPGATASAYPVCRVIGGGGGPGAAPQYPRAIARLSVDTGHFPATGRPSWRWMRPSAAFAPTPPREDGARIARNAIPRLRLLLAAGAPAPLDDLPAHLASVPSAGRPTGASSASAPRPGRLAGG